MKKFDIKNVDWFQVGVGGLTLLATLAKTIYDNKRFDARIDKDLDGRLVERVEEIVNQKLKK